MPRYLVPKRSGAHRIACFALYRALLTQCSRIPVQQEQRTTIRTLIRNKFRKNVELQSQRLLIPALEAGYDAHALLSAAAAGSAAARSHILALLQPLLPSPKRPKPTLIPPAPPASTPTPVPKPKAAQRPAPYPTATPVLSRPYPIISGPRHVPKLVNANAIPFLRFKKPQSPFLSRIIRDKIKQRQRHFNLMYALDDNLQVAADEDRWDELIWEEYGIGDGVGPNRGEAKWTDEVTNGSFYVKRMISEHAMKCRNVGRAMQGIVDREEVLFRRERVKRMRIRQRESRERWGEALQTTTDVAT